MRIPPAVPYFSRRQFLAAAAASPLVLPSSGRARDPIYIGDMHFHLFFFGRKPAALQPLARNMASGRATLVSWSLVGDVPWLRPTAGGFKQSGAPLAGEAITWFNQEIGRVQAHITEQGLKIARTPDDVEKAVGGVPHVVLSVEGASFLDDTLSHLRLSYLAGVRHVQLVHFIRNQIGDIQTERSWHNGLTGFGEQVVAACNQLGILIDLAHCSDAVVRQVLALSKTPVVWSHSSVQRNRSLQVSMAGWQARQLSLDTAKAIANQGGVVGLWGLSADVGNSIDSYTDRILELAAWLGEDHVAFGTDMNALASPAITSYADLRRVVDLMEKRRIGERQIRKIAIGNYARVLQTAMRARTD